MILIDNFSFDFRPYKCAEQEINWEFLRKSNLLGIIEEFGNDSSTKVVKGLDNINNELCSFKNSGKIWSESESAGKSGELKKAFRICREKCEN